MLFESSFNSLISIKSRFLILVIKLVFGEMGNYLASFCAAIVKTLSIDAKSFIVHS
jgi:hypothetical protein